MCTRVSAERRWVMGTCAAAIKNVRQVCVVHAAVAHKLAAPARLVAAQCPLPTATIALLMGTSTIKEAANRWQQLERAAPWMVSARLAPVEAAIAATALSSLAARTAFAIAAYLAITRTPLGHAHQQTAWGPRAQPARSVHPATARVGAAVAHWSAPNATNAPLSSSKTTVETALWDSILAMAFAQSRALLVTFASRMEMPSACLATARSTAAARWLTTSVSNVVICRLEEKPTVASVFLAMRSWLAHTHALLIELLQAMHATPTLTA